MGAVLFGRPDFKWQSRGFPEETFWLLGRDACALYATLPVTEPHGKSQAFQAAGYFVHRTGWTERDSHAVFDRGGMGAPTGGHGHADALSLVLFSGGRDLLIDSGTFVYNGAAESREYFRSTRAHNTVVVDGRDQSEQAGTFQWKSRATVRELTRSPIGDQTSAGEHGGYLRLSSPISHRRRVSFGADGACVVVDELLGTGVHTFDFLCHFPPGADVQITSESPLRFEVTVTLDHTEALLILCTTAPGAADVIEGWISPRYGQRKLASVLRVRVTTTAPLFASTSIGAFARKMGQKGVGRCVESAELLSSMSTTR